MESFWIKIKRGEGPVYSRLKRFILALGYVRVPIPGLILPLLRLLYGAHFGIRRLIWRLYILFYAEPLFRGRCQTIGKRVEIWALPEVIGHARLHIGTDSHPRDPVLREAGKPAVPEETKPVRIGYNAWIGHDTCIQKGVTIGESAIIGANSTVLTDIPAFAVAIGNPARVVVKDTRAPGPNPSGSTVPAGR